MVLWRYTHIIFLLSVLIIWPARADQLNGTVTDASNGAPIAGAVIYLEGTAFSDTTDIDGKYLINGIPSGHYTIIIDKADYKQKVYPDRLVDDVLSIDDKEPGSPQQDFRLFQNYPNPFNPSTTIRYSLTRPAYVKVVIYSLTGKQIKKLVDGWQNDGQFRVQWDGKNEAGQAMASGAYIYRFVAGHYSVTRKLVLIR